MAPFVWTSRKPLLLLTLFVSAFSSSTPSTPCGFVVEPEDVDIKEGESTRFQCRVCDFSVNTDSLAWDIQPDLHDTIRTEHVDRNTGSMTSVVRVVDAGRTNQHFRCIFERSLNGTEPRTIRSRQATMTVLYFPRPSDLTCQPDSRPLAIRVGEPLPVRCAVQRSRPAVDLSWYLNDTDGETVVSLPELRDEGRLRVLTYSLQGGPELNSKILTCLVTSRLAFPGRSLRCPIGPFVIPHPPNVWVSPRQVTLTKGAPDPVELVCHADGFPAQFTFFWTCSPVEAFRQCESRGNSVIVSLRGDYNFGNERLQVSCSVANSEGNSTNTSTIFVGISGGTEGWPSDEDALDCARIIIKKISSTCVRNATGGLSRESGFTCEAAVGHSCHSVSSRPWKLAWLVDGSPVRSEIFAERTPSLLNFSLDMHLDMNQSDYGWDLSCKLSTGNYAKTIGISDTSVGRAPDDCDFYSTDSPNSSQLEPNKSVSTFRGGHDASSAQSDFPKLWHTVSIVVGIGLVTVVVLTPCLYLIVYTRRRTKRGSAALQFTECPRLAFRTNIGCGMKEHLEPFYEEMSHSYLHQFSNGSFQDAEESHLYESRFCGDDAADKKVRHEYYMEEESCTGMTHQDANVVMTDKLSQCIYGNDSIVAKSRVGRISTSSLGGGERKTILADIQATMPPLPIRQNSVQ